MEPASKLRAIEVRRMSHVTGTLKWAAGNAHAELWRRSVANQGGTAEEMTSPWFLRSRRDRGFFIRCQRGEL